jgi:hypothetical protein
MIDIADYQRRAEEHAPKTPAEVAQCARDLIKQGFSDHTIASILKIDVNAVRLMLGPREAS